VLERKGGILSAWPACSITSEVSLVLHAGWSLLAERCFLPRIVAGGS